ncbi:fungal fruit body lectin, partial [Infundibulicybe gibba]
TYEINVRIVDASDQKFKIVEKTTNGSGDQWSEFAGGGHTLIMRGSGTSAGLRFAAPSGELFVVFVGIHNYVRWCDIVPNLVAGNTAVKIHPTYYGGDRGGMLWQQAAEIERVNKVGRKISIVFAQSSPAFYATIFISS